MCANKFTGEDLKRAASRVNLALTDEQAKLLAEGRTVNLSNSCPGVLLVDLGGGCGLYYNPPFGVSVCCM